MNYTQKKENIEGKIKIRWIFFSLTRTDTNETMYPLENGWKGIDGYANIDICN